MADASDGNVFSCQVAVTVDGDNASQASSSPGSAEESKLAEGGILDEDSPISPIPVASVNEQEEEPKDKEEQEQQKEKGAEDDDGEESVEEDGTLTQESSHSQDAEEYSCEGEELDENDENDEEGKIVAVQDCASHGHAPLSEYDVALGAEAVLMAAERATAALRVQCQWRTVLAGRVASQARELISERKENEKRLAAAATVTAQFLVRTQSASLPVQHRRGVQTAEEGAPKAVAEAEVQVCAQAQVAGKTSASAAAETKALALATSERQARAVELLNSYGERIQGQCMLQGAFAKLHRAIMEAQALEKAMDKLEHATSKFRKQLAFKHLRALRQDHAVTAAVASTATVAAALIAEKAEIKLHAAHRQASATKVQAAFRRWVAVRAYPTQKCAHRLIQRLVSAHDQHWKSIAVRNWRVQTLTVVNLQRLVRGYLARQQFQRSQVAILRIQAWYRKSQLRRHLSAEDQALNLARAQDASLKLQSMARDLLAGQEAQQRKEALADLVARVQAVLTIQRMTRRCLGRMAARSAPLAEEIEAAIPLHWSTRGHVAQVKPQHPRALQEEVAERVKAEEEITTIVADAHLLQPTVSTLEHHETHPVAKKRALDVVNAALDISSVLPNSSQLNSSLSSPLRPGRLMAILRRKNVDKSVEERVQAYSPEATAAGAAGFPSPPSSRQVCEDEDTNEDGGGADISQSDRAPRKSSLLGLSGWLRPGRTESVEDGKMDELSTRTRSRTISTQATQGTVKEMGRKGRTFNLPTCLSSDAPDKGKEHVQQSALLRPLEVEVQEEEDNRPVEQLLSPCPWLEDGGAEDYPPTLVIHHQEEPEMPALPAVGKMHAVSSFGCNPFALLSLLHLSSSASKPPITLMTATPDSPVAAIESIISEEGELTPTQPDLVTSAPSTIRQLQCGRDSHCRKPSTSSSGERLSRAFQAIKLALDPLPPEPVDCAAARRASAPVVSATAAGEDRYSSAGQRPSFTSAGLGVPESNRSSRSVSVGYSSKAYSSPARPGLRDITSTLSYTPPHEAPYKCPIPTLPMVRTQAQFRSFAAPKQSSVLRKPSKTSRVFPHHHVCGNARQQQQQSPQRTKHCVAKSAQRGANDFNQGVEKFKEYSDYHGSSGEGKARKKTGNYRSQRLVPETLEVDVARFYRKQCERLVSSVEGIQPWRVDRDGKKVARAAGQSSTLHFGDALDHGDLTREERARCYRAAPDMKSLMVMVSEDLKAQAPLAVANMALTKQVHKVLASLEASPESRRLVSSSFSVLRFYVAHEPDACNILTTHEAVRILFDAMQAHVDENEIMEDGLLIFMGLTERAKNREMIRSALPVYGLNILATFQARIDQGSPGHHTLESLSQRLSGGGIKSTY